MRLKLRLTACSLLLMVNATLLFAQWEWAGGIYGASLGTVGSAGKWIVASGTLRGGLESRFPTDGGESWSKSPAVAGPTVLNPVLITTPTDTFALAVGAGYSVFRLRDTAQSWVRSDSGLSGAQVRQLAALAGKGSSTDGVIVAASPILRHLPLN